MLKKLMKYDFKALYRVLLPVYGVLAGVAVVSSLLIRLGEASWGVEASAEGINIAVTLVETVSVIALGFCMLSIFALVVLAVIWVYARFYQNMLTNEGYLTHTLPVKSSSLLVSKAVTAMIAFATTVIAGFAALMIFFGLNDLLSGTTLFTGFFNTLGAFVREVFELFGTGRSILMAAEVLILVAAVLLATALMVYLSMIIGSVISRKHKLAAAFASYFGVNVATQILSSVLIVIISVNLNRLDTGVSQQGVEVFFGALQGVLIPMVFYYAAVCVGMFLLSNHLLKNKLNI